MLLIFMLFFAYIDIMFIRLIHFVTDQGQQECRERKDPRITRPSAPKGAGRGTSYEGVSVGGPVRQHRTAIPFPAKAPAIGTK
jgi:hypothetical protein